MCPPATTPDAIDDYTHEQIFLVLEKAKNGSALPNNVSEDINPYQYLPSNLPAEIWFLVQQTESKKSEHGLWKAKGEACPIYQNGSICGWRSTLEFFKGPNGQKTGWVMQEYKTEKEGYYERSQKQSRSLCSIFRCSNDMPSEKKPAVASRGNAMNSMLLSAPNANPTSGVGSTSESQAKSKDAGSTQSPPLETSKDVSIERLLSAILSDEDYIEMDDLDEVPKLPAADEAIDPRDEALINQILMEDVLELDDLTGDIGPLPAANEAEDPRSEALSDQILKEGFMELDDLEDPEDITGDFLEMNDMDRRLSPSTSSVNTSHRSLASEDDFFATLRNMDDDKNGDPKGKGSSYKCRNMGPVKPDEVIIQLAPSGSLVKATGSKAGVETRPTSSTNSNIQLKPPQTQPLGARGQITEKKVEKTLHRAATKNKFKKYLCFFPF
ncbi:NAC domain-containing protein 89-like [Ipomoea triloba]|uniref:NAC domain-containing protein 89-like n=1 Tax=Ipomoea triloba TaxID=35885 RepID=UPI00125DFCEA|nr:NAC domain-containing protein 89-like [Ipomoea triloba]